MSNVTSRAALGDVASKGPVRSYASTMARERDEMLVH